MSMEDILKVLVNSRQQGSQQKAAADPMTELIGSLLGGVQSQGQTNPPVPPASYYQQQQQQQTGGLGSMMGLLEMVMGGNQGGVTSQVSMAGNPIMMLLQPYVEQLAKKMNIPPQIAMIVVSYVAYKLLAHHPTSGRDSNSFDLDDLLKQMGKGRIDPHVFQDSGMVRDISRSTGLDEATATKTLNAAFRMFGKQVQAGKTPTGGARSTPARARPSAPAKGSLKASRVKGGVKSSRPK